MYAIVGRLGLFAAGQDPEDPLDPPRGTLLCDTVRATTLSALSGPTLTLSSNLDCQGVDVLNAPSITTLQHKTEAISRHNEIATAIVGQLLVYEGGDDPSSGVTPLGAISCGTLNANDNITANANLVVYGQLNGLSVTGGKYSQTGPDIIIQDIAQARSIINYGVGNLIFDSLTVGDNYHIKLSGSIQTDNNDQQLQLVFRLGFTTIHTTTYINLDSVSTSYPWELELDFTIREETLVSNAQFTYNESGGRNDYRGWSSNYETIIDTSNYMNLTATAQWDNADNNNILIVKQFLVTKTF